MDSFVPISTPRLESVLHPWCCQNEFSSAIKYLLPLSPLPDRKLQSQRPHEFWFSFTIFHLVQTPTAAAHQWAALECSVQEDLHIRLRVCSGGLICFRTHSREQSCFPEPTEGIAQQHRHPKGTLHCVRVGGACTELVWPLGPISSSCFLLDTGSGFIAPELLILLAVGWSAFVDNYTVKTPYAY